ncbi:ArsA-related P-loop ATPase [Pelotomaculum propionicicum]|uniref:Iron-sulfur cluster carrier protein n=1 Tax=Pelotomaculum propionicicum TaxID=258475 RepID=A0A4Y7RVR3_9FIRM|nr:ArsA-related P-loop ATPase [Pelotomaculum propionicicum]NLI12612.1 AAA family ATPase [Peptococcaceae bacterium]TEB12806.1 Iron-sulfur cluster carrier protein [Pelotomaculum propionicicum]
MKLAVSGKGGVGKTTIAAALVQLFSESHRLVYAIDADPDVCLAAAIGVPDDIADELKPLVEKKDLINAKTGGEGAFFTLNPKLNDELDDYCISCGNIKYLRMGGIKRGGSACYCRENSFLHAVVSALLLGEKDIVIMDMGAGIEHLSRGTARGVDLMLVVVEPSLNSIKTAALVKKLATDLGIKKIRIIGNKIGSQAEKDFILNNFKPEEVLGFVSLDAEIREGAMKKRSIKEVKGDFINEMTRIYQKMIAESN